MPEDNEPVRRFLGRLGDMAAREGDRLTWVLGIDMAHMGSGMATICRRWRTGRNAGCCASGTVFVSNVCLPPMRRVSGNCVKDCQDDLKWCGSSPLYTFLRAVPEAKGTLRGYEQWNIDEQSVVSLRRDVLYR